MRSVLAMRPAGPAGRLPLTCSGTASQSRHLRNFACGAAVDPDHRVRFVSDPPTARARPPPGVTPMPIVNRVADLQQEVAGWRRDLHAHPELGFDVHRTAGIVAGKLKAFGCDEIISGIGRTGVVGVIRGSKAQSGKVIGLRADMDALPIEELTGLPYRSTVPGKMHACGHDGHTAMLLGAAKYLAETRNFSGTAVVIFQ